MKKTAKSKKSEVTNIVRVIDVHVYAIDPRYTPGELNKIPLAKCRVIEGHDTLACEFKEGGIKVHMKKPTKKVFSAVHSVIGEVREDVLKRNDVMARQIEAREKKIDAEIRRAHIKDLRERKKAALAARAEAKKAKAEAKKAKPVLASEPASDNK